MGTLRNTAAIGLLASLGAIAAPQAAHAVTLDVPQDHPRLWYGAQANSPGAARLARARAYLPGHPLDLDHWQDSTRMRNHALQSLLTGDSGEPDQPGEAPAGCVAAVDWLRDFDFPSADQARWSGEDAILIYDWCHAYIDPADRAEIIGSWNARLAELNGEWWGGPGMPANNYYWGYLRNSLLWGIASYHENPQAQSFIDEALTTRYASTFLPWYQGFGAGGVPLEGGQYGPYMVGYPVVAFTSAKDYGYDAWNATDFWRDAAYYLQYAATPAPTRDHAESPARFELFPFNDDQFFELGGSAENGEYADLLSTLLLRDPASALAAQADAWLTRIGVQPAWWIGAELASADVPGAAPVLPLDYYAAGARYLYGRRSADANATAFMLQMGGFASGSAETGGVGHTHLDAGSFQLWRNGRWLSRETAGYGGTPSYYIEGLDGAPDTDIREAIAHNSVLFEGRGQIDAFRDFAEVLRLHSAPGFAYAAVDLTDAYRAAVDEDWEAGDDWPFAETAIREFVYLRELDALVVLDRLQSGSDSLDPIYDGCCDWDGDPFYTGPQLSAAQVRKSFVLHAGSAPQISLPPPGSKLPARARFNIGSQRMDLTTLLPHSPAYRVIAEGGDVGQQRLEYDVSGSAESYLLNVIALRDAGETRVSAKLTQSAAVWRVTLTHPMRGRAVIEFQRGLVSQGGSVSIDAGAPQPLHAGVQGMTIGADGPVWETLPAAAALAAPAK